MSETVTTAVQVDTFPFTSVTVSVTVFAPRFVQLKVEGETESEAIPHASELPLFTCAAVIVTVPPTPRLMEIFWQTAVGGVTSATVTIEEQVETFPFTSVTVNETEFAPTFAQVKDEGETLIEAIPQLSVLPLLIWAAVIPALPTELRFTVISWQTAIGKTSSATVAVAVQVETLPFISVTVIVTVLAPTLAQVKEEGETVILAIPQASLLPLFTSPAAITAVPEEFN